MITYASIGRFFVFVLFLQLPHCGFVKNESSRCKLEVKVNFEKTKKEILGWATLVDTSTATRHRSTVRINPDGSFFFNTNNEYETYDLQIKAIGFTNKNIKLKQNCGKLKISYKKSDQLSAIETAKQLPASHWQAGWKIPNYIKKLPKKEKDLFSGRIRRTCLYCHQFGGVATQKPRNLRDWKKVIAATDKKKRWAKKFGEKKFLDTLVSWGKTLDSGFYPKTRQYLEKNLYADYSIHEWTVGGQMSWLRDVAINNRLNPAILPKAPKGEVGHWIYIGDMGKGDLIALNPKTGKKRSWSIPTDVPSGTWSFRSSTHLPWTSTPHQVEVDFAGNIVLTANIDNSDKALPPIISGNHDLAIFYPATETWKMIKTACHNLNLRIARSGQIWTTGTSGRICTYDPPNYQEKIHYTEKSMAYETFVYGLTVTKKDVFIASQPYSDKLVIIDSRSEKPRKVAISGPALLPGNLDHDSNGDAWVAFGNGYIGKYGLDKNKWKFWKVPSPESEFGATDVPFSVVVDRHGLLGPQDNVYIPMVNSDSILSFNEKSEKFQRFYVPVKGFYVREAELSKGAIWAPFAGDPSRLVEETQFGGAFLPRVVQIKLTN